MIQSHYNHPECATNAPVVIEIGEQIRRLIEADVQHVVMTEAVMGR